jgi:hypothetical protein
VATATWQLLAQRQPNGTWRGVDERLTNSDNIPKVSLFLPAEDIKERSDPLYPLIPNSQINTWDPSEVSRLHVQRYDKVLTNRRVRQAQSLGNQTNRGEWLTAGACQNSRVQIVKRRAAVFRFAFHI